MTKTLLIDELVRDEGEKLTVYDDATGKPIKPGSVVVGHPTIAVGRALDTNGVTPTESRYLLSNSIDVTVEALRESLKWFDSLSDVRQRVLANMAYNLGVNGLLKFQDMLRYCEEQRWGLAADEMVDSSWYSQVGERAERLEAMMRTDSTEPVS